MQNYFIVGIDPGHTMALAALDLRGNFAKIYSSREGINEAISKIQTWGSPTIIATDVSPPPDSVYKIASFFNAKLYFPSKDIREEEKRQVLRLYEKREGKRIAQNNHERDALSAAVYAYRGHQNTIRSILSSNEQGKQKFVHLILQGYTKQRAQQIIASPKYKPPKTHEFEKKQTEQNPPAAKENMQNPQPGQSKLANLQRANNELAKRVQTLEKQNKELKEELANTKTGAWARMRRGREIMRLRSKISSLEKRLKLARKNRSKPSKKTSKTQKSKAEKEQNSKKNLKGLDSIDKLRRIVGNYRKKRY